MDHRGRSVDPELVLPRQRYSHSSLPRQEKRAQSAAPTSIRSSKFYNDQLDGYREDGTSTLPKSTERALINQHVNPYQEFPSLRRGFTLQGMSISEKDKTTVKTNVDMVTINEEGDACAYYFWAITLFFFVIALINFFVLISIVVVLGIGPHGMEAIEFLPDFESVKFLKDMYASDITLGSGVISGYAGEPIIINSTGGEILFQIDDTTDSKPQLRISSNGIEFKNIENFKVVDPRTGELYFDAFSPQISLDSHTLESLIANEIETNRIVSPIHKDLHIQSDSGLDLEGAEGISVEAKRVEFDAGQNIEINSKDGNIILDGERISLGPMGLPLGGEGFTGGEKSQYKVCICSPSGKLFAVPVYAEKRDEKGRILSRTTCDTIPIDWEHHPCEDEG